MRYPEILSIRPEPALSSHTDKDTMLYALGIGMGLEPDELKFVYEDGLVAVPTMAVVMGAGSGSIFTDGGIDLGKTLHGEQRLRMHRPLPAVGTVLSSARILSIIDKGAAKGALLNVEATLADPASGEPYCTNIMTIFCRGDGGFGGSSAGGLPTHQLPTRPHDREVALKTRPDQAMLYRLTGDRNPLHVDPKFAKAAGFDHPIQHGLCTYGFACRAVMRAYCDMDPARLKALDVRFASPVFPGETIVTRMWRDGSVVSFECRVAERDVTVVTNGRAEVA